jgi:hypothetical protein
LKLTILRGHHRYHEAKRQKLPIYYIVDEDDATIFELEGDSRALWQNTDFVKAYARAGHTEYRKLISFQKKYDYPMGVAAALLAGRSAPAGDIGQHLKRKTFKVVESQHAKDVTKITETCRELDIPFATSKGFVMAVSAALWVEVFDADAFCAKLRLHPKMMSKRSRRDEYLEEIEALHNYKARGKRVPLAYEAIEEGRARAKTFGYKYGKQDESTTPTRGSARGDTAAD